MKALKDRVMVLASKNPLIGGIGDGSGTYNTNELIKGIGIEKEHIGNSNKLSKSEKLELQADIAKDHLSEIPDYYTRLEKLEKEAKSLKRSLP